MGGGGSVDLPVATPWQRWAWATFLRDAVDRYGPDGTFWFDHPAVPYLPIRTLGGLERAEHRHLLELDEPGPVYAKLLRLSGRVLHREPRCQRPARRALRTSLQIPPNTGSVT